MSAGKAMLLAVMLGFGHDLAQAQMPATPYPGAPYPPPVPALPRDLTTLMQSVSAARASRRYDDAIAAQRTVVNLQYRRYGGENHVEVAEAFHELALILEEAGRLDPAIQAAKNAHTIRTRLTGGLEPGCQHILYDVGRMLRKNGTPDAEEMLLRKATEVIEQRAGPASPLLALALNDLGEALHYGNREREALVPIRRAHAIFRSTKGDLDPDTARAASVLAQTFINLGDYVAAEPLLNDAIRACRGRERDFDVLGADLNRLAIVRYRVHDIDAAERLWLETLDLQRLHYQPTDPIFAFLYTNLGMVRQSRNDLEGSEHYQRKAVAIWRAAGDLASLPKALLNLSSVLIKKAGPSDVQEAEALLREARDITGRSVHPEAPPTADILVSLGNVVAIRNEYGEAEQLILQGLAIKQRVLGPQHEDIANTLIALSSIRVATGRFGDALKLREDASEIVAALTSTMLSVGSPQEKRAFFVGLEQQTERFVSLHAAVLKQDPRALRLALTTVLRWKGRVLEAATETMRVLRARAQPEDVSKIDNLRVLQGKIAALSFSSGPGAAGVGDPRALAKFRADAEALERELGNRYAELHHVSERVTIESVQRRLLPGSALVEWLRYQPSIARANRPSYRGSPHYLAYVVPATGAPGYVDLGDAAPIDNLVVAARAQFADRKAPYASVARQLDALIFQPVRRLLGEARNLYLSPDGPLQLVPFAALVDEQGRFLLGRYRMTYLTSGRDLAFGPPSSARGLPVIVAAPDYGGNAAGGQEADPSALGRGLDAGPFSPLKGAAAEAHQVESIVKQQPTLGTAATEAFVKGLHGPSLLHFATHGFFLNAPGADPMLRSGLALAGANLPARNDDDGRLTALEASTLDLIGTKLVVLSACQTGVGAVTDGDGVYGLRRAFVLAGAETQVISLWEIPDLATTNLMGSFYSNLFRSGRSDALRDAQLAMVNGTFRHPYYWAAFILSGDDRTMDGKLPPSVRVVVTPAEAP